MPSLLSISQVNSLGCKEFVEIFGNIVECCSDVATTIFQDGPFPNTESMVTAAWRCLDRLPLEGKELVLKLHPDLGGRLAAEGKLTAESTREQQCAQIHNLSSEEKIKLGKLNESYKRKFGFPFVICARENKAAAILQGLESRLANTKDEELLTGVNEVKKIVRLRILEIVAQ